MNPLVSYKWCFPPETDDSKSGAFLDIQIAILDRELTGPREEWDKSSRHKIRNIYKVLINIVRESVRGLEIGILQHNASSTSPVTISREK